MHARMAVDIRRSKVADRSLAVLVVPSGTTPKKKARLTFSAAHIDDMTTRNTTTRNRGRDRGRNRSCSANSAPYARALTDTAWYCACR